MPEYESNQELSPRPSGSLLQPVDVCLVDCLQEVMGGTPSGVPGEHAARGYLLIRAEPQLTGFQSKTINIARDGRQQHPLHKDDPWIDLEVTLPQRRTRLAREYNIGPRQSPDRVDLHGIDLPPTSAEPDKPISPEIGGADDNVTPIRQRLRRKPERSVHLILLNENVHVPANRVGVVLESVRDRVADAFPVPSGSDVLVKQANYATVLHARLQYVVLGLSHRRASCENFWFHARRSAYRGFKQVETP
jgi:hypothetical protein